MASRDRVGELYEVIEKAIHERWPDAEISSTSWSTSVVFPDGEEHFVQVT